MNTTHEQSKLVKRTIWRFKIDPAAGANIIEMPKGARIVAPLISNSGVSLYAEVEPDAPTEKRAFGFIATGANFPHGASYVCTLGNAHVIEMPVAKEVR